ncbi:MAG: hypothetical protein NXI30_12655 [bacterium]|nr:hypothetical protein [bacterium]
MLQTRLNLRGHQLVVNGIVGPDTIKAMSRALRDEPYGRNVTQRLDEMATEIRALKAQQRAHGHQQPKEPTEDSLFSTVRLLDLALVAIGTLVAGGVLRLHWMQSARDTTLKCLDSYLAVFKDRVAAENAAADPAMRKAQMESHFRGLLDLHWAEMFLWQQGVLKDEPYRLWLCQRRRDYFAGVAHDVGDGKTVSYQDVWEMLSRTKYWEKDDTFHLHMDAIHGEAETGIAAGETWADADDEAIDKALAIAIERSTGRWRRFFGIA